MCQVLMCVGDLSGSATGHNPKQKTLVAEAAAMHDKDES
jgi:hypothetical protein